MKSIKKSSLIVSSAFRRTRNLSDTEFLKFSKTEGWEFTKTIIPFALFGCEIFNSQLGATHLFGYLPSRIQRGLME